MRKVLVLFLALFALLFIVRCDDDCEDREIEELNFSTLSQLYEMEDDEIYLIMFYSPTCGACKQAKPIFEKAFEELKSNCDYRFAMADCTEQIGVCQLFDIKAYPTIYAVVEEGLMYEFKDSRAIAELKRFIEGKYKTAISYPLPYYNQTMGRMVLMMLDLNSFLVDHKKAVILVFVGLIIMGIASVVVSVSIAFYLIFIKGVGDENKEKKE